MTEQLAHAILFSAGIALLSWRARFLTPGGALTQFILGSILLGLGGWEWTVPMVAFFLSSSIFSHLWKNRRAEAESSFEKSSRRDAAQVVANGGIAGVATLLWFFTHDESLFALYLGAVAAATADTWATELGTLSKSSPVLITSLERVERGRSGAVSVLGIVASLAGAFLVSLTALPWVPSSQAVALVGAATIGGVAGSLADSLAGAVLQAQFRCMVCQRITERKLHCGSETRQVGGFRLIRNDQVNLICTLIGGGLGFWLLSVFLS